jgi:nicotinamide-nucleotide amidase
MNAEILAIGDEITSGQTLDTNSQWLSRQLEELGVAVHYHTTVGDQLAPSAEVFRQAIARADLVVATGGLGPTADDLTREALARATDRPLQLDAAALDHVRGMFARRHRPMPPQNELQAMFPAGSRVVHNPHGTAPGIDLDVPREGRPACRVFCLPGVPAEMIEMWRETVAPAIVEMLGAARRVICRRLIHCFGAGESQIESMLPDMIRRGRQPAVGITASKATITLRIAAEGDSEAECRAAMEPTVATIRQCLGTLVFGEGDDRLQDVVVRLLRDRGATLATVERGAGDWASAGLLAEWLGGVEGAAKVYLGGLVLTNPTAESVETMASCCREQFGADYGLAVAGWLPSPPAPLPKGEGRELPAALAPLLKSEGEKPTVQLAIASVAGVATTAVPVLIHPELSRIYVAKQALNLLRLSL